MAEEAPSGDVPVAACGVVACSLCDAATRACLACAADFRLAPGGARCVLPAEQIVVASVEALLSAIGAVIVLGIAVKIALICYAVRQSHRACASGRAGGHSCSAEHGLLSPQAFNLSQKERNILAIRRGMANWYRARLTYNYTDAPDVAKEEENAQTPAEQEAAIQRSGGGSCWRRCLTSLCDVHTKFIVGVGLPMFYNFHFLPAAAAVLTALATRGAVARSGFGDPQATAGEAEHRARHFAKVLQQNLAALYVALLAISLWYVWSQRRWRHYFDKHNSTMEDYTLQLKGLPRSVTCEAQLQGTLEESFGLPVVGVSIGYDLNDPQLPELNDKIWHMKERLVVSRDCKHGADQQGVYGYSPSLADPEDLVKINDDEKEFRDLCKHLSGSGSAWVVFRSKADTDYVSMTWKGIWVDTTVHVGSDKEWAALHKALGRKSPISVWRGFDYLQRKVHINGEKFARGSIVYRLDADGLRTRTAHLKKFVHLQHRVAEPPEVLWENLGTRPKVITRRLAKTVAVTIAVFLALLALVFLPLGRFLLRPYAAVHAAPGFLTQQLQGFIFGLANNVIGITMWMQAWGVGFQTWDDLNAFIICFGVTMSFFNTAFFLNFGLAPELGGFGATPLAGGAVAAIGDSSWAHALASEEQLANTFYSTLVPGWMFSGFMMGQVMGNVWPNVQNFMLLIILFVCDCLPYRIGKIVTLIVPWNPEPSKQAGKSRITARQAELIFQPKELALAWDYAAYIVMPTVCLSSLFVLSPAMGRLFPVMLAWVLFMYTYHRSVTLRICKKQMHAGGNLSFFAECFWGVPLSIVAAAWAYWGYRLGENGIDRVWVSFVASMLVYLLGIYLVHHTSERPYGEADADYWRVHRRMLFSWFNCNPVHLLKSLYCPEALGDKHVRSMTPFFFGKEYMFAAPDCHDLPPEPAVAAAG